MPLLYYWRRDNYLRDLDMGAGYHLNQSNPLMHGVEKGDSLWAFTRAPSGQYVLAAELIVQAKTHNPPNFRYGRYRVWGDVETSRYFEVEGQPSVEQIIRSLSVTANADVLGLSFQGHAAVRPLTRQDHLILQDAARELPLEPRARIFPEERLEAALLMENREAVKSLVREESPGFSAERRTYLYQEAPSRNRKLVDELHGIYDGKCQLCAWDPKDEYDKYLCHGHHIHWLSRSGEDSLDNMALVCPNHHTAIHRLDAQLDYADMVFDFGIHREELVLNLHLEPAR